MRFAYDSITATDIPLGARIVAGYVDGIYRWSAADWVRFPSAVHVRIAISPNTNDGHVLDVETGDAYPWEAPGWVLMRRASGADPTVYINWSNWGPTRMEFQSRGIPEPHYWLASYDGIAEVPVGTVAKQYANSALAGGHYDLSAAADFWPGVDRPGSIAPTEVIVMDQPTFDQLVAGNGFLQDMAYRLEMLLQNENVQQGGPSKGQGNKLKAELDAINGVTLLRLEGEIKALQVALDALRPIPGPVGPPGAAGPPGPAGVSPTHFTISGTAEAQP